MKQVDKQHYRFGSYCYPGRWASYYCQIKEILLLKPSSVLEIGVGDGVVKHYVTNIASIKYTTADIAEDLSPDVVANAESLPFQDNSFDVVCAFQVLEHIPFEKFDACIREMARVSKKYAIISLPHFGPPLMFEWKIPFFPRLRYAFKLPYPKQHNFNGQHYWEIGKRGYSVRRIRNILADHGRVEKEYVPYENQYHRFYVIKVNKV